MQELLIHLYGIHATSGHEWPLISFIKDYIETQIPEANIRLDKLGNLYITKGNAGVGYPTLSCHLDQVQELHSDDFETKTEDGMLYGWSEKNQRREGLGADDKNGIFICLRCLHDKMRYDKKWLKSDEAMNHIDIALRVNNIELAKGLVDILNPEDKTIAAKKLKVTK